ncbi:hypothetical protein QOT17_017348 [Balamuthia mandrillaris]
MFLYFYKTLKRPLWYFRTANAIRKSVCSVLCGGLSPLRLVLRGVLSLAVSLLSVLSHLSIHLFPLFYLFRSLERLAVTGQVRRVASCLGVQTGGGQQLAK